MYTLGTSAGTQPFEGFHHTSLALETEKGVYFLDAGECCGYTAKLCGVDLLKTKAVFISHPHMDHVGGLGNLLWYIRKMGIVTKQPLTQEDNIDIFTPCKDTVDGFFTVLKNTEGDFKTDYTHTVHGVKDGFLFDNGDIKVTATHTNHMPECDGSFVSYSYKVETEGKTVVFSGDMRLEDIDFILPEKCDAFFVETGHHQIEDICNELKNRKKDVKKLYFVHHGGYIMKDVDGAKMRAKKSFGENTVICRDGESYEI